MARIRSRPPLVCLLGAGLLAATLVAGPTSGRAFLAGSQVAVAASVSLYNCPTMQQGSSGDCVRALQQALNAQGASLQVDGQFGPATYYAVRAFQASVGLTVDGIAGPRTMAALTSLRDCPTMRWGSSGVCVRVLQQALNAQGASLQVDGQFGPATYYAVRAFQASVGLTVDGIAGPATLAALTFAVD
jgi:peptidoglycan hydrolase-like protein with peptidoglycan-binding domain